MRVHVALAVLGVWALPLPTAGLAQRTPHLEIALPAKASAAPVASPSDSAIASPADTDPPAPTGPTVRGVDLLADGQTRDLLRNGFPARLHYRLELWGGGGVFDHLQGTREWDVVVRYDPLSKHFRAARIVDDRVAVVGDVGTYAALTSTLALPYVVPLVPPRRGKYYYSAVLDVEMLSLSDLDEVERWLRGELRPAVQGHRNPGTAVTRGLRTLFLKLIGGERRHYEARSKTFRG